MEATINLEHLATAINIIGFEKIKLNHYTLAVYFGFYQIKSDYFIELKTPTTNLTLCELRWIIGQLPSPLNSQLLALFKPSFPTLSLPRYDEYPFNNNPAITDDDKQVIDELMLIFYTGNSSEEKTQIFTDRLAQLFSPEKLARITHYYAEFTQAQHPMQLANNYSPGLDAILTDIEQATAIQLDLKNKDIIDIGCGNGMIACEMLQHEAMVTLVEPDPNQVNPIKKNLATLGNHYKNTPFYNIDLASYVQLWQAQTDPIEFDIVTVFSYLIMEEQSYNFLADIKQIMTNDGTLIIGVYQYDYRFIFGDNYHHPLRLKLMDLFNTVHLIERSTIQNHYLYICKN